MRHTTIFEALKGCMLLPVTPMTALLHTFAVLIVADNLERSCRVSAWETADKRCSYSPGKAAQPTRVRAATRRKLGVHPFDDSCAWKQAMP